jgi:hypothetical protein
VSILKLSVNGLNPDFAMSPVKKIEKIKKTQGFPSKRVKV